MRVTVGVKMMMVLFLIGRVEGGYWRCGLR